jgi:hypothetical protein
MQINSLRKKVKKTRRNVEQFMFKTPVVEEDVIFFNKDVLDDIQETSTIFVYVS